MKVVCVVTEVWETERPPAGNHIRVCATATGSTTDGIVYSHDTGRRPGTRARDDEHRVDADEIRRQLGGVG